jgi:hypothetical protein
MGSPHVWLKAAIEDATGSDGVTAWPVEMTGGGEPPYVIYLREATERELLLAETFDETPDLGDIPPLARFTLTIYCDSYVQAWEIAGQISAALHRFKGSADGETIDSCLVIDERDGEAGFLEGREQPTFTVEQTVEIRFQE